MRIIKHKGTDAPGAEIVVTGYTLWLSANDTRRWERKPGAAWPCSTISGRRLGAEVDATGLCRLTVNGRDANPPSDELCAIVSDHLPPDCRHLWPTWDTK